MLPPLVADVNIASRVVQFLRSQSVDVVSACEENWGSYEDEDILAAAHARNRFVLTHDSDFGTLVMHQKHPSTGIVHLRPGGRRSYCRLARPTRNAGGLDTPFDCCLPIRTLTGPSLIDKTNADRLPQKHRCS